MEGELEYERRVGDWAATRLETRRTLRWAGEHFAYSKAALEAARERYEAAMALPHPAAPQQEAQKQETVLDGPGWTRSDVGWDGK